MSSQENVPQSPSSPKSPRSPAPKRQSVIGFFDELPYRQGSGSPQSKPSSPKSAGSKRMSLLGALAGSSNEASPPRSLLRRTFRNWRPSIRGSTPSGAAGSASNISASVFSASNLTLRMSDLYRMYGDNWATTPSLKEKDTILRPTGEFKAVQNILDELHQLIDNVKLGKDAVADFLMREMAHVVYGSNNEARKILGLDETLKICQAIFEGHKDVEYSPRSEEYQMKLDKLVRRNMEAAERHVIRSRREVVQHAAAFQYLVDEFVCRKRPMSEDLIKQTHAIMVKNGGAEDAGVLNSKEFGGLYRQEDAYVGTTEFPKPSKIGEAMQAMVKDLAQDLESAQSEGVLDPFMIAATYSDRFVNIHPFRDGNGRMCRLILNAIHVKYAGIVVNLGEHDQNREDYIAVAAESREVRGHPGALGHLVLNESSRTLRKFVDSLKKSLRAS